MNNKEREMYRQLTGKNIETITYNEKMLVPTVVIDSQLAGDMTNIGGLLMMAWSNDQTLRMTLDERLAVFWSRSRQEIWRKGDTSGQKMLLRDAYIDCDLDTVVYDVKAPQITCHNGTFSCFEVPNDRE